MLTASTSSIRRASLRDAASRCGAASLIAAALLASAAAPQVASAKARHHHAHRAQAPTTACSPDDLRMVGSGREARLFVCDAKGRWTEAVFAVPATGGGSHVVNAGRA